MIYFDNSSTTPVSKEVLDEMLPYFSEHYGNPSSMHSKGLDALKAVYNSRKKIADLINCKPNEVIFTGSGTESINLAILGFARKKGKGHIIMSAIEHPSVKESVLHLKKEGFEVSVIDVDDEGLIDLHKLRTLIRDDTILVSIIYANNEIGVIQEVKEISKLCKEKKVIFHTDACQAVQYLDLDIHADLMSFNGSKMNGPKGVGVLINKGLELEPLVYGGGQEFGLRSGTENVPLIVGFTKAFEMARTNIHTRTEHVKELSQKLKDGLMKISNTKLNGCWKNRLPNNVNISFFGVEGESMILMLNEKGIHVSTGSACSSKNLNASHVLLALGLKPEWAHTSIRFTLNDFNTSEEVEFVIEEIKTIVENMRKISAMKDIGDL